MESLQKTAPPQRLRHFVSKAKKAKSKAKTE